MKRGRIIRLSELTPDMFLSMQERYASLLRDYIALAETHVELMKEHADLAERHYTRRTIA